MHTPLIHPELRETIRTTVFQQKIIVLKLKISLEYYIDYFQCLYQKKSIKSLIT